LKLYSFITSPNGRKVKAMLSHLMRILPMIAFGVAVTAEPICVQAATYPPVQAYMIPKDEEVALARTAAPANISGSATIKVLGLSGYKVEVSGTNGFVCSVMRGFTAPTYTPKDFRDLVYDPSVRAPICFNPLAAEVVMPYYELRTELGLKGQSPDEIMSGVQAAYATGKLPKRDAVSFGYMWSAEQNLGPGISHWHPHMMVFAPYQNNAMLGNNQFGLPVPFVSDDADTPFSVVLIPVDDRLAIGRHTQSAAAHSHATP